MTHLLRGSLVRFFLLVLLCAATSSLVFAQSTTDGAIGGTVSDPHKALVPNATVTVRSTATNREDKATTDDGGGFRIVQLRPGLYLVTVNAQGFATYKQENVVVEVGRVTTLEIPLALAGATAVVEVTGEAPVVDTSRQDFANNLNQTSINELPINGRRWSNFALLTPGATPDGNFGLISFRGISGLLNNSTVDGGDNNQAFFSEERGRTRLSYVISQASVSEFQVNTSNYSSEYGRAAGAVVNAVTKSGSNGFHAGGFYYIRDNVVGATNPFTKITTLVGGVPTTMTIKPDDRRQQFGANIGGPLVKDKAFFFFSWDQQKRNFPGVGAPSSPTFLNPITVSATCPPPPPPPATPTPGDILACRGITQPQTDAGLAYLRGLTGLVPRTGNQYILFPKLDWSITPRNLFTVSYNRLHWTSPAGVQTQPIVFNGIASFGDDFVDVNSLNARLVSTLSSHVINEARYQFSRDHEFQNSQPPGPGEPTTGKGGRPPQADLGLFQTGKPNFLERVSYPNETRNQFADSVTISHGKHVLKFGGEFNRVHDLLDNLFQEGGAYSYDTLADFLTDFSAPSQKRYSSYGQGIGPTAFEFTTWDYSAFVQDDWRAMPRLTVNLGLRYEYEKLPSPQIPNPLAPQTASFPSDKNNIGPRVGFAWAVTGDGKTSLRAGYGIYYGRIINSTISNGITNTGVATGQIQISLTPSSVGSPTYPNVLLTASGAPGRDIIVFSPTMANPLIHQADVIFEREIAKNTVASVSYLVSLGRSLPTFVDTNLNPPTSTITYTVSGGSLNGQTFTVPLFTGARPNTNFNRILEIRSAVESRYDAVVFQFNRRFTNGLQFQNSYTIAKATDTGQVSQTFTSTSVGPVNPFRQDQENATSNFEIRHRFVSSLVWSPTVIKGDGNPAARALLNGYTISPIISVASGAPFTGTVSGSAPFSSGRTSTGILGAGASNRPPFLPRNAFRFPRTANIDLRFSRRFKFTEATNLELLVEAFNLFNHVNVTALGTTLYSISGTTLKFNPFGNFATPSAAGNTVFRERQIQFAARFAF
jgi:hypothetical protein